MLVDVFMYAGEIECLQMRLRELRGIADEVHIIEAMWTFQGKRRDLSFSHFIAGIAGLTDAKIIHHVITDFPKECVTTWDREDYQRNYAVEATKHLQATDTVFISDADEIPRASVALDIKTFGAPLGVIRLGGPHFMYEINAKLWNAPNWYGTHVVSRHYLKSHSPKEIRGFGKGNVKLPGSIDDAAWHFSFMGGKTRVLDKLQSWSHSEDNHYATDRNITNALYYVRDWNTGRELELERVIVDNTWPLLIQENPQLIQDWSLNRQHPPY